MDQEQPHVEMLGKGISAYVTSTHGFGADAVLLAHFSTPRPRKRQADLCSGCGIVPLLWCREDRTCAADAFELLPEAAELARLSIRANQLANVRVFTQDIRTLSAELMECYDLVTCNPPYRAVGTGKVSTIPARETARGETQCTLEDAVRAAAHLLTGKGRFCLCHRPARLAELFSLLSSARLEPKRLRLVQQRADTAPWLVLVEARKNAHPGLQVEPVLCCEQDGTFSEEWRAIYQGFCATRRENQKEQNL